MRQQLARVPANWSMEKKWRRLIGGLPAAARNTRDRFLRLRCRPLTADPVPGGVPRLFILEPSVKGFSTMGPLLAAIVADDDSKVSIGRSVTLRHHRWPGCSAFAVTDRFSGGVRAKIV